MLLKVFFNSFELSINQRIMGGKKRSVFPQNKYLAQMFLNK